jgi:hypothetical protein
MQKRDRGQFYTTNYSYILDGLTGPPATARCILEPFAGKGDLLDWVAGTSLPIEAYDIEPKREDILQRDTLRDPPDYTDAWVITNPPYLARNKAASKELYDAYETNDLYKCFVLSLCRTPCCGGIILIPAGFFFSSRDVDTTCRRMFMETYTLSAVKYFEESVFTDTTTTIVAIAFTRASEPAVEQTVAWTFMPSGDVQSFQMRAEHGWIIGGEIHSLPVDSSISFRRHVEGQPLREGEQQTFMTLNALDSGTAGGRIKLTYAENVIYPAKESSRTYATIRITGRTLSAEEQQDLCTRFNDYLEKMRAETRSLFLPQFRESKEYARKRIPFELAYRLLGFLLTAPR